MACVTWPKVIGEAETLEMLHDGFSVARCGDGEAAIMDGAAQVREPANSALAHELREVLQYPHPRCLVGIPSLDTHGPKYANWSKRADRFLPLLNPDMHYVSAFVTRPDSAPWIRTLRYARRMEALWRGKRVVLVSERDVAIHRLVAHTAGELVHLLCPHAETSRVVDRLQRESIVARPDIILLSCGPAATVLANRLTYNHLQAIDIGSAGGFLLKELYGLVTTLRVFCLGMPCTGTTSIGAALEQAGFQVAHNRPRWMHPTEHTGVLLERAHAQRLDPVALMPGVGAIVHPSALTEEPVSVNSWPQFNTKLLRSLRHYHPDCVFVLNVRPVEHWIQSVMAWKDFRQRLTAADIPGLRPGRGAKDEELQRWIVGHWEKMRQLFAGDAHFIEIDIEDTAQCEQRLTAALGRDIAWPHLSQGVSSYG